MYVHQVSLQSLEAIVLIGAKSVGRISQCCMHVCMQIQGAAVCYTLPSTHRRFPPRPTCSLLCSVRLGAMITQVAPFFSHSTTLDNFCVQVLQLITGCFSSSLPLKTCVVLTLLPPVDRLRNQFVAGVVPDASTLCSTYSHRLESLFLATPSTASVHPWYLQASLHSMIHKQTRYKITHRQVGKRTVTHANMLQQRAAHNS